MSINRKISQGDALKAYPSKKAEIKKSAFPEKIDNAIAILNKTVLRERKPSRG